MNAPATFASTGALSPIGMSGLRLEISAAALNSLTARAEQDPALIPELNRRWEEHELHRAQFRADLEDCSGTAATLIERRLAL